MRHLGLASHCGRQHRRCQDVKSVAWDWIPPAASLGDQLSHREVIGWSRVGWSIDDVVTRGSSRVDFLNRDVNGTGAIYPYMEDESIRIGAASQ
jgi:hypothetical protein